MEERQTHKTSQCDKGYYLRDMTKWQRCPVVIVDNYLFWDLFLGIVPILSSRELLLGDLDFSLDSKVGYLILAWPIRMLHLAHHSNCFREGHMTVKIRYKCWFKLWGEILFLVSWTWNCKDGSLTWVASIWMRRQDLVSRWEQHRGPCNRQIERLGPHDPAVSSY